MSDAVPTPTPAPVDPVEPVNEPEPKEVDWKAEARKHEARAKENAAKAKANETAAQRLAEIEDANKSELEKAAARAEAAEKRAAELEAKALRSDVAAEKGVPAALLTGSTKEELEAAADALIAFRGEKPSNPLVVPKEGSSPASQPSSDSEFVKTLFTSGD
jgi:hypothetical protein